MPPLRVPVLGRRVEEGVTPAVAIPRVQDVGAFGGEEAALIGQIGRRVTQFGEARGRKERARLEFKKIDDELWANQEIIKFQDWSREKAPTYKTDLGTNARGSTDRFIKDMEKYRNTVLNGAENNEQRRLFNASFASKRHVLASSQNTFEVDQWKKANVAANDAKRENAIRAAHANPFDELALQDAAEDLRQSIDFTIKGMLPEQRKNVTAEIVSDFHLAVLNGGVVEDAEAMKEYYAEHEKDILPENREAVEKVLNKADIVQFAQRRADEIFIIEKDPAKRRELARKELNPEKRKALEDYVNTRIIEQKQDAEDTKKKLQNDTFKNINAAPNKLAGDYIADSVTDPEISAAGRAYSKTKFELKTTGIVTDREVQAQIFDDIDAGKIDSVDDLLEFQLDLSSGDYNRIITELRNKKNPDAKTGFVKYNTAKTAYQTVKGVQYDVELDSKEFMFVQGQLDAQAQILGRDLTPVEANEAAGNALVEGEIVGSGLIWDDEMTLQDASQAGEIERFLPFINDEDIDSGQEQREIDAALAKKGIVTDNETVKRLYKKEAILNIPLSPNEADQLRRLISQIGILRPIQRR